MKLRNKETGQIYNACHIAFGESIEGLEKKQWKTLEEFNEDWEDVPEEKKYWHIDADFGICSTMEDPDNLPKDKAEMGNLFETKEEAEKAVEKLIAWKRLQKKFDFHITGWDVLDNQVIITTDCDFDYVRDRQDDGLWADLDLVFNGNLIIRGEE